MPEIQTDLGWLNGYIHALAEERSNMVTSLRELCTRVRELEVSLAAAVATRLDADRVNNEISDIKKMLSQHEAIKNKALGAIIMISVAGGAIGQIFILVMKKVF